MCWHIMRCWCCLVEAFRDVGGGFCFAHKDGQSIKQTHHMQLSFQIDFGLLLEAWLTYTEAAPTPCTQHTRHMQDQHTRHFNKEQAPSLDNTCNSTRTTSTPHVKIYSKNALTPCRGFMLLPNLCELKISKVEHTMRHAQHPKRYKHILHMLCLQTSLL